VWIRHRDAYISELQSHLHPPFVAAVNLEVVPIGGVQPQEATTACRPIPAAPGAHKTRLAIGCMPAMAAYQQQEDDTVHPRSMRCTLWLPSATWVNSSLTTGANVGECYAERNAASSSGDSFE